VTPDSCSGMVNQPIILFILSIMIMLGNTFWPVWMRTLTVIKGKMAKKDKDIFAYHFLLEHPRRAYTHMFPASHTAWLALLGVSFFAFLMSSILISELFGASTSMDGLNNVDYTINVFFATVNTRTSGFNSVDMSDFSYSITLCMIVWMYIAASPVAVLMHHSSHVQILDEDEQESESEFSGYSQVDIEGHWDELSNLSERVKESKTIGYQLRYHFLKHGAFLIALTFAILAIEQEALDMHQSTAVEKLPDEDPTWSNRYDYFGFYKILFELASAYGTVGLSLGYFNRPYSFSGVMQPGAQWCMIVVMFLGRTRGLPRSIDSSVVTKTREELLNNDMTSPTATARAEEKTHTSGGVEFSISTNDRQKVA